MAVPPCHGRQFTEVGHVGFLLCAGEKKGGARNASHTAVLSSSQVFAQFRKTKGTARLGAATSHIPVVEQPLLREDGVIRPRFARLVAH